MPVHQAGVQILALRVPCAETDAKNKLAAYPLNQAGSHALIPKLQS